MTKIYAKPKEKRITSVDMLRGIAALSVCIYHFTNGNIHYFSDGYLLKEIGSIGWAGVEIFFVISGFIIPFSLYQSRYKLKNFKDFLLKRMGRIEPPYFFSILLLISLNYFSTLSPYFKGAPFSINYFNLALHFAYLNDFFKLPWLSPVFWTLAIEFQFYLLMGLIFPVLNHQKIWVFILVIVLLCGCSLLIKSSIFIFHYISFFALGILIFKRKTKVYLNKYIWILEPLLLILIYMQFSIIPFIAAALAWSILVFYENWRNKWILWLGTISYSLYLTHISFGGKIINLSMNFFKTDFSRSFVLLFALIFTVFLSYLFYRFIEVPAIKFSHSLMKNNKDDAS